MNEENNGEQPIITMGSVISISYFEDNNVFMYVDGHIKSKVMIKNFTSLTSKSSKSAFL